MDLTPVSAAVPAPVQPPVDVKTDQAKEQKLAEAQASKQSVVYFSPVIKIDRSTSTAIFQYRDRSTGEVTREFPTKNEIEAYTSKRTAEAPPVEEPVSEDDSQEERHISEDV